MKYNIDDIVTVRNEIGSIRYIGATKFAPGIWYGIELNNPNGKNDGSVQGEKYFECSKSGLYGVFVRESMILEADDDLGQLKLKLKLATEENLQYKDELNKITAKLQLKIRQFHEVETKLDMSKVDNEYLQSTKLSLEQKIEELSSKYQTLQEEYSIVSEELEINHELEKELKNLDVGVFTSSEIQKIVDQNRVNEELIKKLNQEKVSSVQHITLFEKEISAVKASENHLKNTLTESSATIEHLKERVESFAELEKITDKLSLENEELVKTISKLQSTIDELTELHELNLKIEDDSKANELELLQKLNSLELVIDQDRLKIASLEKQLIDHESTINGTGNPINAVADTKEVKQLQDQLTKYSAELARSKFEMKMSKLKLDLYKKRNEKKFLANLDKLYVDLVFDFHYQVELLSILAEKSLGNYPFVFKATTNVHEMLIKLLEYNYNHREVTFLKELSAKYYQQSSSIIESLINSEKIEDESRENIQLLLEENLNVVTNLASDDKVFCLKQFYLFKQLKILIDEILKNQSQDSTALDNFNAQLTEALKFEQNINAVFPLDSYLLLNKFFESVVSTTSGEIPSELSSSFESSFKDLKLEFKIFTDPLISIYDMEIVSSPSIPDNSELLTTKDNEITDLKLNIALLQQNMKLFTKQTKSKIQELENQLQIAIDEKEIQSKTISHLEKEKFELKNQVNAIDNDSLFLNKKFETIETQREYNEKIKKLERLIELKQRARSMNIDDLSWLNFDNNIKIWSPVTPLQSLSRDIRKIAENTQLISINSTNDL
ncbi:NIP100 [Candida jiufengensis]|uniref:NIP100 n=1 Tax=Candida jiufengensis TaxID=497108 RepID=UPI002224C4CE|nr:NIP100 [Candida jiufengensis]KAI5954604.1 NIP100 [Candida jiufengensis]